MPPPLSRGEKFIRQGVGRNPAVWLTTHRLIQRRQAKWWASELETVSIALDQISGMSIGYLRRMRLLVVGVVFTTLGLFTQGLGALGTILWAIGMFSTGAFILTGRRGLVIKSNSQQIKFTIRGMSRDDVQAFVFALEEARAKLMGVEVEDEAPGESGRSTG